MTEREKRRTVRYCPRCHAPLWAVRSRERGNRGGWLWFPRGFPEDGQCAVCVGGVRGDKALREVRG